MKFKKGDRVRVDQPTMAGEPYSWHGRVGIVTREPGEPASPRISSEPSTTYAVLFDGSAYSAAPFRDADMDDRYHALIVAEEAS